MSTAADHIDEKLTRTLPTHDNEQHGIIERIRLRYLHSEAEFNLKRFDRLLLHLQLAPNAIDLDRVEIGTTRDGAGKRRNSNMFNIEDMIEVTKKTQTQEYTLWGCSSAGETFVRLACFMAALVGVGFLPWTLRWTRGDMDISMGKSPGAIFFTVLWIGSTTLSWTLTLMLGYKGLPRCYRLYLLVGFEQSEREP